MTATDPRLETLRLLTSIDASLKAICGAIIDMSDTVASRKRAAPDALTASITGPHGDPVVNEQQMRSIAEKLDEGAAAECQWYLDDIGGDSVWETECKNVFEFTTEGPKENGFLFCPYCGKRLTPVLNSEQ